MQAKVIGFVNVLAGNIKSIRGNHLKAGESKSCGCIGPNVAKVLNVGDKFGHLTIINRDTENTKRIYWICECDCGNRKSIRGDSLVSLLTQSCGCDGLKAIKILHTGDKFGRWTVIKRANNDKWGATSWECQCECGKTKIVNSHTLRSGKSQSCGCSFTLSSGQALCNSIVCQYKQGAKKRNLEFTLNDEQFHKLTKTNCYYCGAEPSLRPSLRNYNGGYVCNGIDRVDNKIGYLPENCVSACKICNLMKREFNINLFLNFCENVSRHQIAKTTEKISFQEKQVATHQSESFRPVHMVLSHGEAFYNSILLGYKRGANRRGYEFILTNQRFRELTKMNCYYCGKKPELRTNKNFNGITRSGYVCNGVDRMDNNVGYTLENSVSSCTSCNFLKSKLNAENFISHCVKITNHSQS